MADTIPDVTLPQEMEETLARGIPIELCGKNFSRYIMQAPSLLQANSMSLAVMFFDFGARFGVVPEVAPDGYRMVSLTSRQKPFPVAFGEYFVIDVDGKTVQFGKMPEKGLRLYLHDHESKRTSAPVLGEFGDPLNRSGGLH